MRNGGTERLESLLRDWQLYVAMLVGIWPSLCDSVAHGLLRTKLPVLRCRLLGDPFLVLLLEASDQPLGDCFDKGRKTPSVFPTG